MPTRIQSPSSINAYKQCSRKYYYRYILKLPTIESIHLIRGKIIHCVLEDFFKIEISTINKEHYEFELNIFLQSLLKKEWENKRKELFKEKHKNHNRKSVNKIS